MGLMFVPRHILATTPKLLVINGFSFFPSTHAHSKRRTLAKLSLMKSRLEHDAYAQLSVFCTTAGISWMHHQDDALNSILLNDDLDALATTTILPDLMNESAKVQFLHSTSDPIVSTAAIRDTMLAFERADHVHINSNSHNLPNSEVELVRKLIFEQ
jgi:hypothetical protein